MRAAWILNTLVVWPVLFYGLGRVYRAFVRGRHSRNLYDGSFREIVLNENVGKMRARLGLDTAAPDANLADKAAFAGFLTQIVGIQVAIVIVLFVAPAWLLS